MKSELKIVLVLSVVCLVAGLCLGAVYKVSYPSIEARRKADERAQLKELFPQADSFEEKEVPDSKIIKKCFLVKQGSRTLGYVFIAANYGYSGDIELMVGVDEKGNIAGTRVLAQAETPGLGTRIEEDSFINQFNGWNYSDYKSGKVKFDAITGSTISSKAVLEEIEAVLDLMNRIKK